MSYVVPAVKGKTAQMLFLLVWAGNQMDWLRLEL
jgi:hypothetical protein